MGKMIFLYGPPGSGKSSVGRRLAESLSLNFYDLDEEITRQAGAEISAIFATDGEQGFRKRETQVLQETLVNGSGVVALGGGALLTRANRSRVDDAGLVLCLGASVATLIERLRLDGVDRPLLSGDLESEIQRLCEDRKGHYKSFQHQLDTDDLSPSDAVQEAEILLGFFRVRGMGSGYDVRARSGLLNAIGKRIQSMDVRGPIVLVTDEIVGKTYAAGITANLQEYGFKLGEFRFPPGEKQKSLETASKIWEYFTESRVERKSLIIGLGGGVVGDLAGFAAATYLRGIPWLNVPTSLLAMVDSSLGGKTGINLAAGKNLVGSFHAPEAVLADLDTLRTLPEIEMRNGLAEVIKHGVIADPILFEICEAGELISGQSLDEVVRRAMAVKIRIIQLDPYEAGIRESLNFGHTIGHAVEMASDFAIRHGEAIAIGMVAESRISDELGHTNGGMEERLRKILVRIGLPVEIPPSLDRTRLLKTMQFDKKRQSGVLRFSLPISIGEVKSGIEISPEDVQKILE
ncbi:MAG: 3-dehydroquinate synthase [Chloroflexi bacterium]|nr:3-dehydroquinate synthase [Chloroflexota bacterium]